MPLAMCNHPGAVCERYSHTMPRKYTPEERIFAFWSKVAITANPDKCWEWQAYRRETGYGMFRYHRKTEFAHRIAWQLTNGEIPDGLIVCHKCDNPCCVNPSHLFVGTYSDNSMDRNRKGRHYSTKRERNGRALLSQEQVDYIRQRYKQGGISQQKLADKFGVHQTTISHILLGMIW